MREFEIGGVKLMQWKVGPSSFLANPFEGARLMNWNLSFADGSVRDVIYWPEDAPNGGVDFAEVRGGNPVLFPFAGSSWANGNKNSWETTDGLILPYPQHGFAAKSRFDIDYIDERGFAAKLVHSDLSRKIFPYDFDFYVTYRFNELSISCELTLQNNSDVEIPWGAGQHFYFKMPWADGLSRKNYILNTDAKKAFYIGEDGILQPTVSAGKFCFGDSEMYNRIHTNMKTGIVSFGLKNGEENIFIRIDGGGKPRPGVCLVTWTQNEASPFYCVEPWLTPPNCPTSKRRFVPAKSRDSFSVEVGLV